MLKRPKVVCYGYKSGKNILSFLGETGTIEIEEETPRIMKILPYCTGHATTDEIVETLKGKVSADHVRKTIFRLERAGIVIDSNHIYSAFHRSSENPMVYPHEISARTLARISNATDVRLHRETGSIQLDRAISPFLNLLKDRKSHRTFGETGISDPEISGLLEAISGRAELRSVPSGGGLYPMSVMVAILKDTQLLAKGIYEYHRKEGVLGKSRLSLDMIALQTALEDDHLLSNGSLVIFVVADMLRAAKKYANRSYRHLLLEAGHMAQNAYLFSAEQGVGIVEYGGYTDTAVANLLGLKYPDQAVLTVLIAGTPKPECVPGSEPVLENLKKALMAPKGPVTKVAIGSIGKGRYQMPLHVGSAEYAVPTKRGERKWRGNAFSTGTSREITLLKVLAESWERYVPDSMQYASWETKRARDLKPDEWLDPYAIYPIMERQQNRFADELSVFDQDKEWQWVTANRYNASSPVHVPVDAIYYQRGIQNRLARLPCIWASSNGVAAHSRKEIAIRSATLELIERDGLMTMWYGKRPVKALASEYLDQVVGNRYRFWQSKGCHVSALDLSTDTVPVVVVLIHSPRMKPALSSGSAAASTYEEALSKAFTEAELMALGWTRRKFLGLTPNKVRTVDDHGLLYANPRNTKHVEWLLDAEILSSLPSVKMSTEEALHRINPWLVDMTPEKPKTGLHVIRAIAPELLPINFGHATEPHGHPRLNMLGFAWSRSFPAVPHFIA